MNLRRSIAVVGLLLGVSWFAFVAIQYTRQRSRMRAIASELHMENRDFHVIAEPLAPPTA